MTPPSLCTLVTPPPLDLKEFFKLLPASDQRAVLPAPLPPPWVLSCSAQLGVSFYIKFLLLGFSFFSVPYPHFFPFEWC